jgi:hypothetical protein
VSFAQADGGGAIADRQSQPARFPHDQSQDGHGQNDQANDHPHFEFAPRHEPES